MLRSIATLATLISLVAPTVASAHPRPRHHARPAHRTHHRKAAHHTRARRAQTVEQLVNPSEWTPADAETFIAECLEVGFTPEECNNFH